MLNQVFNCDETGLNFRLMPNVTLAASFEKSAAGRKKSKERITLNLCSNASDTINSVAPMRKCADIPIYRFLSDYTADTDTDIYYTD